MNVKLGLSHRSDDPYWKTPIGYVGGRPVFPMGGGADDDTDDDADLDDDPDGGDDGDDGDGDGSDLSESEQRILDALNPRLEQMGNSIADRLVQAQRTRERKESRRQVRGGDDRGSSGRSSAAQRLAEQQEQQVREDIREARYAFKDAFGDTGVKFTSTEERDAANKLGRALVESAVRGGADPDDAGLDAAKQVATVFQNARKAAESSVMARLEKQGVDVKALQRSSGKGQQPGRGPRQTSTGSAVRAGEDRARQLFPNRVAPLPGQGGGTAK